MTALWSSVESRIVALDASARKTPPPVEPAVSVPPSCRGYGLGNELARLDVFWSMELSSTVSDPPSTKSHRRRRNDPSATRQTRNSG